MLKEDLKKKAKHYHDVLLKLRHEISKVVVGQNEVLDGLFRGLLSNGHVLVEGVPGIAKTLIVKSLAQASGCKFSRIQFTVDLLPTDITGITSYSSKKGFHVIKGPVFANFLMGDEINRAPPKTQSALLEAMQEHQTTIGKTTFKLPAPFFVMATQNPIEQSGTYPLPEAQLDRFLFKIFIGYPSTDEEQLILSQNMTLKEFSDYKIKAVTHPSIIHAMQNFVKEVYLSKDVEKYIVKIVDATRNPDNYHIKLGKYIQYGCSPRASIGLYIAAKADAVLSGKAFVTPQNVKNVAYDVLRHRLLINYEGQADDIKPDLIIKEILAKVKVP
jgi:MoxR-like ATPase